MTGTASQIQWAEQIKPHVNAEFDRVAKAFQSAASNQAERDQVDTRTIVAILEEKRAEVMGKDQAGYFIRDWRELNDQVRRMIASDPRYREIKDQRAGRRRKAQGS